MYSKLACKNFVGHYAAIPLLLSLQESCNQNQFLYYTYTKQNLCEKFYPRFS